MKTIKLLVCVVGIVLCVAANTYAIPTGAEYYVDELNEPLKFQFSGLGGGTLMFDLFLTVDASGGSSDGYFAQASDAASGGSISQIDYEYFNKSFSNWVTRTVSLPTGKDFVRFVVDDYGSASNPTAYFRNFRPSGTYQSGGAKINGGVQVPEPNTLVGLGIVLLGFIFVSRKRFKT